ncbi:MAG: (2Fe-2S)-binding protein [Bacteroidia bacterium]|nr:(2Fe-2S)-binding protein [Bacteroidia bacterium]
MPKITIDGVEYEYEGKHKLLTFALEHGVEIPYFCYHPAMSTPTNCRLCLVDIGLPAVDPVTRQPILLEDGSTKINFMPKPTASCNQELLPGMVVKTHRTSEKIAKVQKSVLEFILINHPLDCPICDQAGECPLQINTYKFGPEGSRFELEKVHKPKRIQLGPRVMLDAERCINCTRCVRFTREISGSHQLSIISRGDRNYPAAAPGQSFDDPYSMNTIDLCPVGALTSTAFRFKARVWEMNYTPTICTGCSRNCATDAWLRDNEVLRYVPRENKQVNQYWMCDEGRLDIAKYNEKRISGAKLSGETDVQIEKAYEEIASLVKVNANKILFIGSASASVETNYVLKKFASELGVHHVYFVRYTEPGWGDNFLRKDERSPNVQGALLAGLTETTLQELNEKLGQVQLAYIVEDNVVAEMFLKAGKKTIVHSSNYHPQFANAAVILPAATHLESQGLFINEAGAVQQTIIAKRIKQMTPEMWIALPKSRLDAGGVAVDNWRDQAHVIDCLPSWLMLDAVAHILGKNLHASTYQKILSELKNRHEILKTFSAGQKRKESFKMSQFEFAIR